MTADFTWLPTLFVAGFPKAGTSALHRWIADHPDALGSIEKEACFFVDRDSHLYRRDANIDKGLSRYRSQFVLPSGSRPRVIVESTPGYVYQRAAIDHIPDLPSAPRCIFMVREPADQIRSLYTYFRNNWTYIPASFEFSDYLAALRSGGHDFGGNELASNALRNAAYVDHLLPWRDRLGAERMRVYGFDRLRADPRGLMRDVATWVGLDPAFYETYDFPRENDSYRPRWRPLQRVSVALRGRLPKGAGYARARALYRSLNTVPGAEPVDRIEEMDALRRAFADPNRRLAAEFDLDLSEWET